MSALGGQVDPSSWMAPRPPEFDRGKLSGAPQEGVLKAKSTIDDPQTSADLAVDRNCDMFGSFQGSIDLRVTRTATPLQLQFNLKA